MKKLNVPLIYQAKGSDDCGLACLLMVLKYYGHKKSLTSLKKDLKVHAGVGTYSPQLGTYMIKNGFKVELVTQHPGLFTIHHRRSSQKDLLIHIKKLLKTNKKKQYNITLKYFVDYMEVGGKIKVKIPGVDDIQNSLKDNTPMIALLTSIFLTEKQPKFNFHFNVVAGLSNQHVYINDPLPDRRGGKKKCHVNDFLFGVHASAYADLDNASLLRIKK